MEISIRIDVNTYMIDLIFIIYIICIVIEFY